MVMGRQLIQDASGENAALKAGLISPFHLLRDTCPVIFNFLDRSLMFSKVNNKFKYTHTCTHTTHMCMHTPKSVLSFFHKGGVHPNYLVCDIGSGFLSPMTFFGS